MKMVNKFLAITFVAIVSSCGPNGDKMGHSTPIDSSNVNGAPGATYGPDDPAYKPDSNHENVGDTGTNAGNVHNNGDPESKK